MNEFMEIELSPKDGFYEWEELVNIVEALVKLGWKPKVICVLDAYKIKFSKRLDFDKVKKKIIKTKQIKGADLKDKE